MNKDEGRRRLREIVGAYRERGDHVGWFEALYAEAGGDESLIPWAEMTPQPRLVEWLEATHLQGNGRTAVVVGCGLGDDAEVLAARGFSVTAFDVAPSAIEWCKRRFPTSSVDYVVADLFHLPPDWSFDFVLEIYTTQSLPIDARPEVIRHVAGLVAPGGSLLMFGRLVAPEDERPGIPWPLTRAELNLVRDNGLMETAFDEYVDGEHPPVRRFLAQFQRSL